MRLKRFTETWQDLIRLTRFQDLTRLDLFFIYMENDFTIQVRSMDGDIISNWIKSRLTILKSDF